VIVPNSTRRQFEGRHTKTRSDDRTLSPIGAAESSDHSPEDSRPSKFPLFNVLPDAMALVDELGIIRNANNHLATLSGYRRDEIEGETLEFLVPTLHRDVIPARRKRDYGRRAEELVAGIDLTLLRSDRSELAILLTLSPMVYEEESWQVLTIRDNRGQREGQRARTESELRFRVAFQENMAPMTVTDPDDRITAVNDAFCQMIGFTREELLGQDSKIFTFPEDVGITEESHRRVRAGNEDQMRYVKRYLRKDGRVIISEVSRSPARDAEGRLQYFVFSERDITQERALAAQLSHQALHDPLTGIANRALFMDRLFQAHTRLSRKGGMGAVLHLDLDDFKGVNDTHGHLVGDQLLVAMGRRLELIARPADSLCRSGDDEFLYLAEGLDSPFEAEEIATRVLNVLTEPFSVAGVHIQQHASIGVVVWDATSTDCEQIVRNADVALYEAKRTGKGRHVVFTSGMQQQAVTRFELVQELRQALHAGEISMHYQPVVSLTTTEVVGFEALMRWQHPTRGWIPPVVFIPLAEQSDLILELGAFALREAAAAASLWEPTGGQDDWPYVTVNLSAHQFHDPHLVAMIEEALLANDLGPERLIIEITESVALLDVAETLNVIEHLNRLGIGFALDDFGTGYSSLSYLSLLRPKIIKIDQSFVSPAFESERNNTLLEAIVTLGQKLHLSVLAEGIETQEQLTRLRYLGCELGQGFLFSPAVAAVDAANLVGRVLGS
jgi:diguanylate cyclase (GGDEF)-like protein/PAS domain S-box-containing protein